MFHLRGGSVSISNSNFIQNVNQRGPNTIELIASAFQEHYISSATHDNNDIVDPPKCHPGTRVSFLNQLSEWIKDTSSPVSMTWLHGPAGVGKSAIARSLAEILHAEGLLAGSFFFLHTDPKRNSEKSVIVTLAQQLAVAIPETQPFIADSLVHDPTTLTRSLPTQFEKLIVNPIIRLTSASTQPPSFQPALVIIDGLDECKDPKARQLILKTLCDTFPRLQGWLKFLVASRPEHDIQTFFETMTNTMGEQINHIDLLSDLRSLGDVRVYLDDHFERIKRDHPLRATFDPDWPPEYKVQSLLDKSSGNFIYATTVIKYIESAYDRPQKCLDDVINLCKTSRNPYGELDALYLNILHSSRVDRKLLINILSAAFICNSVRDAFSTLWLTYEYARYDRFVESVLLLEPGDVQLALLDLKSIIGLGETLFLHVRREQGMGIANPSPVEFNSEQLIFLSPKSIGGYEESLSAYISRERDMCLASAVGLGSEQSNLVQIWRHRSVRYSDIRRIELWHRSFSDFLLDPERSKEFHADSNLGHTTIAEGCLQLLSDNCKLMEKYWPDERLCSKLKITSHHVLAHCCKEVSYDSNLHSALKNYNLLDILRIQSYESRLQEFEENYPCIVDYFFHMFDILEYFGTLAQGFDGTDIYDCLVEQIYCQIRSELEIWVPPKSTLMKALIATITPVKINWRLFKRFVLTVCKQPVSWPERFKTMVLSSGTTSEASSRKWPYFLEWMFFRSNQSCTEDDEDWERMDNLVCDFFYSEYWKDGDVPQSLLRPKD